MGARRPAFALMLVLAASAMIFAMAISGAVALRSATIEAATMHDRASLTRDARSVMAIALAGLTAAADESENSLVTSGEAGASGPDDLSSVDELDLPPFPAGIPFSLGSNSEDENDASGGSSTSGTSATRQTKPRGAFSALRRIGLPAEAILTEINNAQYRVTLQDARGGVDINRSDEQHLIDYFELVGITKSRAVAIAHQIVDWRDGDDFSRPQGAEREDYRRRNITIGNAKFESIDQLRFLPAMTSEIFDLVHDDLCVGSDGRTYIGASHQALSAVPGITGSAVRAIESRRASGGPISAQELRDMLGLAHETAGPKLRTTPSDHARVIVEPLAHPGVRLVGEASITDRKGVRIGAVALR